MDQMQYVPEFIKEFPESIYNGIGYRVLKLKFDIDPNDLSEEELNNEIKNKITISNNYVSFSKTEQGVMNFIDNNRDPKYFPNSKHGVTVIITDNISGLDLEFLSEMSPKLIEYAHDQFKLTKEVLA